MDFEKYLHQMGHTGKDVIHKAEQGARYIGNGMLDYKIISESHDKQEYSDKPKLRIDHNALLNDTII